VQQDPDDACGKSTVPRGCAAVDGLCGLLGEPADRSGSIAYAWVRHACANASHAFAHEVGHLLGADHERDTAISQRGPDPPLTIADRSGSLDMGYAFTTVPAAPKTGHATVMGSFDLTRQRVPLFSTTSPAAVSPVDGQATWGDAGHDNARLIEAVAAHVAGRAPPACGSWPPP
jgi:hypothetical protein